MRLTRRPAGDVVADSEEERAREREHRAERAEMLRSRAFEREQSSPGDDEQGPDEQQRPVQTQGQEHSRSEAFVGEIVVFRETGANVVDGVDRHIALGDQCLDDREIDARDQLVFARVAAARA